jgi:quercetin dioxygenase-like cupin family protein
MDARAHLMDLNERIPEAEKRRDITYLEGLVDQNLIFKRADGSIADQSTYLDSVRNLSNTIQWIDQIITSLEFNKSNDVAIVNAIVKFHGVRSGQSVQGIFRNIRYFRKGVGWKLFLWHNDRLSALLHCLNMSGASNGYSLNEKNEMIGVVYQETSLALPTSPDTRAIHVMFENGGHTRWHYHEGWQVLIGDSGRGFVQEKDARTFDLSKGERIFIPPFVWHRHGAKPGENMGHMAVTSGKTKWDFQDSPSGSDNPG